MPDGMPDFLVIGAAKSGTTALSEYLRHHPSIYMCRPKEPDFFANDQQYAKGLDWYRSLFEPRAPGQLCGEASTTYTRWPHSSDAAARIAEHLPNAKLIYILRPPAPRAYSHFVHHVRKGLRETFEEAMARSSIYVDCSLYTEQLGRYLEHFAREQVHVMLLEDLNASPVEAMGEVWRFLGVGAFDTTDVPVWANRSVDEFVRGRTTTRLRKVPGISAVLDMLPSGMRRRGFEWFRQSWMGKRLASRFQPPPFDDQTRAALLERFTPMVCELEALLGRDLGHWKR